MLSMTSRDLFDKENQENLTLFSKKIKKDDRSSQNGLLRFPLSNTVKSNPFRDITNQMQKKATFTSMVKDSIERNNFQTKVLNHNVYLEDSFTIENRPGLAKTNKYTTLSYINERSKRMYKFYCFRDQDLEVPIRYANKSIDNDCYTDDGQIKGAIIKLYKNMEASLKELVKEQFQQQTIREEPQEDEEESEIEFKDEVQELHVTNQQAQNLE